MLTVTEHIELLLLDNTRVTVASLGTFHTSYRAATLIDGTHTFAPPTRELQFSTQVKGDDTLLPTTIARQLQLSQEEAEAIVATTVKTVLQRLARGERVAFGSLGHFTNNSNHLLTFEAASTPYQCADSLGFVPITLSPILRKESEKSSKVPFIERKEETIHIRFNKYRLRQVMAAAVIILFMMLISAPVEHVVVKQDYAALLSTQLFTETNVSPEASPSFELPADEPILVESAITPEVSIETPTVDNRRYWVIVSSLPNQQLAEMEIAKLAKRYNIETLEMHPTDNRVRISLQGFDNLALAQAFLKEQLSNPSFPFKDAWVLKRSR